ncbi:hypothetical protein [Novosphingobium terrae]|uniref:hypothetical protein n=1 Tax=Novosphingobium terrae TaxID=2726189 RepID=UPI00197F33FF|nr:hypothetical protein [Novosphingobium terrae]
MSELAARLQYLFEGELFHNAVASEEGSDPNIVADADCDELVVRQRSIQGIMLANTPNGAVRIWVTVAVIRGKLKAFNFLWDRVAGGYGEPSVERLSILVEQVARAILVILCEDRA